VRFGATLAVRTAMRQQPDFLLLWSAVTDTRVYLRELLRMRLTNEAVNFRAGQVKVTTSAMVKQLEAGQPLDVLGYPFSPELYRQMTSPPGWQELTPRMPTLWLSRPSEQASAQRIIDLWRADNAQADFSTFPEPSFWDDYSFTFPSRFAAASLQWLTRRVHSGLIQ
jgi:hypothetical protein